MKLIFNRLHRYYDETQEPWYALWSHYDAVKRSPSIKKSDLNPFAKMKAKGAALKFAKDTLINDYPEFFQWIEWGLDDLTGHGDPIADEYIDRYFKYGIPKEFKFKFDSTQKDFEDYWEETGAFTGEIS